MGKNSKLEGIFEQGYGLSPKAVMKDKELTIEAKAIYAYLSSYAGAGSNAYPRIETICRDLQITERRLRSHRKPLIDRGYIVVQKNRKTGKFDNNVYVINHMVTVQSKQHDGETAGRQNNTTNNNKVLNNNKDLKDIYSIYKHWNEKDITKHRELTQVRKSAINARLEVYTYEELMEAIDNYKAVLDNDEYYYTHEFTIEAFMNPKNLDNFITENKPFDKYMSTFVKKDMASGKQKFDDVDWDSLKEGASHE